MAQRLDDVLLPDQLIERLGSPFAIERRDATVAS
jgi:hypothetical protein